MACGVEEEHAVEGRLPCVEYSIKGNEVVARAKVNHSKSGGLQLG